MIRPVCLYTGELCIILDQVPTHHFAKPFRDPPKLEHGNLHMKWRGGGSCTENLDTVSIL